MASDKTRLRQDLSKTVSTFSDRAPKSVRPSG